MNRPDFSSPSSSSITNNHRQGLTPRDAAVYIGVKINTLAVWRMTNRYGLPFVKLGKVVRYRKADLDEWINKNISTDRAE